jgi:hypothetical protein
MTSYTSLIHNLVADQKFESVSYSHSYVAIAGVWITECKIYPKGQPSYFSGIGMDSDIGASINTASSHVYAQVKNIPYNAGNGHNGLLKQKEIVSMKQKERRNVQVKNNRSYSSPAKRNCDNGCRCLSFYDLPPNIKLGDITGECRRYGKVICSMHSRWNTPERFISVWMDKVEDADYVVEQLYGRYNVMKGHASKNNNETRTPNASSNISDDQEATSDPLVYLDKIVMPPRIITQKPIKTKEQLDCELDEYMRSVSGDDSLDAKIDEYIKTVNK